MEDKSQFGSAKWLADYLVKNQIYVEPIFVDAGAGDGIIDSNSYYFLNNFPYEGLLIDVSEELIGMARTLYKNNPGVTFAEVGLGGSIYPYRIESNDNDWRLDKIVRVRKSTGLLTEKLSTILRERYLNKIGVLSLDIELQTTEVLKELLDSGIYPETIIIEANSVSEFQKQKNILGIDYQLLNSFEVNYIYIRKDRNI